MMSKSNKKKCICIIPARKGSKRLKNKNILKFRNKPLICHTIESAIKSKVFDLIVVSSDSKKILNVCSKYKSIYLHNRPKKLSGDKATVNEVCLDVLKYFEEKNLRFDFIGCLYATSPLRKAKDIVKTYNLVSKNKKINFSMAVSRYNFPPHQALILKNKNLKPMFKKMISLQSNIFDNKIFINNGSTYFGRVNNFKKEKSFCGKKLQGYFMKPDISIDINLYEDYRMLKKNFEKK